MNASHKTQSRVTPRPPRYCIPLALPFARLTLALALLASMSAAQQFSSPADSASGAPDYPSGSSKLPTRVQSGALSIDQCFIEEASAATGAPRFVLMGSHVSAAVETDRLSWIVRGTDFEGQRCRSVVVVEPAGAREGVAPQGEERLPGVVSRFHGDPTNWKQAQSTWRRLRYPELWAGIDLVLEAEGQTLKSTYVLAAGADPASVRMRHRGAEDIYIDNDGSLVMVTPAGPLVDAAPCAWQEVDGTRKEIPVAFALTPLANGDVDVAFSLEEHDSTLPLFIDPAVLVQAGFLGGTEADEADNVAVDATGCVYICGWARSDETSFPVLVGPSLTNSLAFAPWGDAFVAKLDPTGTTLLYAGFIGGTERDFASTIAVDSLGRAYVAGNTASRVLDGFPAVGGPDLTLGGGLDGWVARVSANGASLEYCGYIGGSHHEDRAFDIDVDALGRAYVVGRAGSDENTFPVVVGPSLFFGGGTDSFVSRIAADGLSFEYCGYVGGSQFEDCVSVVADGLGGAWIAGHTSSDETTFPVQTGPDLTYFGGTDGFVARVASDGSSLLWCGYVGGANFDIINDLDVDSAGSVIVAGSTTSVETTFPVLVGPDLTANGDLDGFVTKVSANGNAFVWSGFIGGSAADGVTSVAVDDDGGVWLTGTTFSTESSPVPFPTFGGLDDTANGNMDSFVARVLPTGSGLDFAGYVGGSERDVLTGIAVVPSALTPGTVKEAWVVGCTDSTEATFPVLSGLDTTQNGDTDAVVVRIQAAPNPWADLGNGLAGTYGIPMNTGTGTLGPGSPMSLKLSGALENSIVFFVLGFTEINAPFKGGVLVPDFDLFLSLPTGPSGEVLLSTIWPSNLPSGFEIFVQWWVVDAAGPLGFSASNAISGTTP